MTAFEKAWKIVKVDEAETQRIFTAYDNDKHEDGRPQWTMMQYCPTCGSTQISNDSGRIQTRDFCSDGGEDHDWELLDVRRTDEYGMALLNDGDDDYE